MTISRAGYNQTVALFLALSLMLCAGPAAAVDIKAGRMLATTWCAQCHVVENDQYNASADVPSFEGIANRSDFDAEKIQAFLVDPHPVMPNMSLTRIEIEDLVAYIASLKD